MVNTGLNFSSEEYSPLREWVRTARRKGKDWADIMSKVNDSSFFDNNISNNFWPSESRDVWQDLVNSMEVEDNKRKATQEQIRRGTLFSENEKNTLPIPSDSDSCWQRYRKKMLDKGYSEESVIQIEEECHNILTLLSKKTDQESPVKGLVVGNVQSGKTSNMAGLIAMAADSGWNFFIVLSGMIDSLREQTRKRLNNDLRDDYCKLDWKVLEIKTNASESLDKLKLSEDSYTRHLVVCLKNKDQLKYLLGWLNADLKKKEQLKVLLIDDEADQGSANSVDLSKTERRTINRFVVDLVSGNDAKHNKAAGYECMNYVSYTATPYANFLSDGTEAGLFPRNFVTLLNPSNIYLGPKQIFGLGSDGCDGMDIIRRDRSPEDEIEAIHSATIPDINSGKIGLPEGLKDAICWFICSVCAMRYRGYKKPISMLIHTSYKVDCHQKVAEAVMFYLRDKEEVKNRCRTVYSSETKYDSEQFFSDVPTYGGVPHPVIEEYPSFVEISQRIDEFLEERVGHIEIDSDDKIVYGKGIHLCIDNSKDIVIDDSTSYEKVYPRLIYPDEDKMPDFATAFIVIGGNTISRGLTIEGLVSTYFARKTTLGDTLMQMSRWFGYRKGYELYPRIWMSTETYEDMCELTKIDEELREFIRNHYRNLTPVDYPPMVRKFPGSQNYLKRMTAKDRYAKDAGYDFGGTLTETTVFDKDLEKLIFNEDLTRTFLSSLGKPSKGKSPRDNCRVWRGVPEKTIEEYLGRMKFSTCARNFDQITNLVSWIGDNSLDELWNVTLAGLNEPGKGGEWEVTDGVSVNKVNRSARDDSDGSIHIGSLSNPPDRYADINLEDSVDSDKIRELSNDTANNWGEIRIVGNVSDKPNLIVYPIYGNSEPNRTSKNVKNPRKALNCGERITIIGITIIIPGQFKKTRDPSRYQTVRLENRSKEDGC